MCVCVHVCEITEGEKQGGDAFIRSNHLKVLRRVFICLWTDFSLWLCHRHTRGWHLNESRLGRQDISLRKNTSAVNNIISVAGTGNLCKALLIHQFNHKLHFCNICWNTLCFNLQEVLSVSDWCAFSRKVCLVHDVKLSPLLLWWRFSTSLWSFYASNDRWGVRPFVVLLFVEGIDLVIRQLVK